MPLKCCGESSAYRLVRQRSHYLAVAVLVFGIAVSSTAAAACESIKLTGKAIPDDVRQVLREVLIDSGNCSARISSAARSVVDQARIMWDYYLRPNAPNCVGAESFPERMACAKRTYCSIGDNAIELVTEGTSRDRAIELMSRELEAGIKEAGAARRCINHVSPHGRFALDVAPSSLNQPEKFAASVRQHSMIDVSRFFVPGGAIGESAFHIEVLRPDDADGN